MGFDLVCSAGWFPPVPVSFNCLSFDDNSPFSISSILDRHIFASISVSAPVVRLGSQGHLQSPVLTNSNVRKGQTEQAQNKGEADHFDANSHSGTVEGPRAPCKKVSPGVTLRILPRTQRRLSDCRRRSPLESGPLFTGNASSRAPDNMQGAEKSERRSSLLPKLALGNRLMKVYEATRRGLR